jgi:uncharacterized protein (DUF427 family)
MARKESVWDYPRPPRVETTDRRIKVLFAGEVVAETRRALRVLETSHPPVYYIPLEDVKKDVLRPASGSSVCEWKGEASYFDLEVDGRRSAVACWCYADPSPAFRELKGCVAFYAGRTDGCFVDREKVVAQPGSFYGGWITSEIEGPFKGEPGARKPR